MLSTLFSKPTKDELNNVRDARVKYQDYLANTKTNALTDVNNNALSPETGSSIIAIIQTAYTWLQKNPNANLQEIMANQDTTTAEIKRLIGTDAPKRQMKNTLIIIPVVVNSLVKDNKLTSDKAKILTSFIDTQNYWYKQNNEKASVIDYSQEMLKINDKITSTIVDANNIKIIKDAIKQAENTTSSQLQSEIAKKEAQQKKLDEENPNINSGLSIMTNTAIQVFIQLLIVLLCLMGGSFAANFAIGRIPPYRVLYFIYGAVPYIAPFVIIYTVYRRIMEGRMTFYAFLPISIEPATTRLGRFLWFPFYWIPDQHAIDMEKLFLDSLPLQVS